MKARVIFESGTNTTTVELVPESVGEEAILRTLENQTAECKGEYKGSPKHNPMDKMCLAFATRHSSS